jgi:hypothetical protein
MKALGKGSIASIIQVGLMIAWWALWIAAAAVSVGAIAYGVILALISNGMVDPSLLEGGGGTVDLGGRGGGDFHVTYDQPGGGTWPVVVPTLLIAAVAVAGSLVIVWRLRKLFDSFTTGDPFKRENATHLRVIWITMIAVEVSRYLLMALTSFLVMRFGDAAGDVRITIEGDRFATWGSILIVIVLAEVFREGARLKEEQELTI